LFDLVGKGGMAEIFLAKTFTGLGTERLSVIKRILPHLSEDKIFCEMLIAEAKLCARLSHANVVHTHDLGVIEDQYYIAMEYVEGFDLNQLLTLLAKANQALPLQFGIYIIMKTLRGLDYAHRLTDTEGMPLGIIHRDVSPTNVLISIDGDVKVCDFGIAKATMSDAAQGHLDEYHIKGKVAYMAPEAIAGEAIDRRADLYAAGILLWELLSGKRLYKRKNEDETMALARAADAPRIADRGFPDHDCLADIVAKALSKNPDERYQSGAQFIDALSEYLHRNSLILSQLKFSGFLMEHFGESLCQRRREREKILEQLDEYRQRVSRGPITQRAIGQPDAFALVAGFEDDDDPDPESTEPSQEPPSRPQDPVLQDASPERKLPTSVWIAAAILVITIIVFFSLR
jgi:serine/threonine-protein kinase